MGPKTQSLLFCLLFLTLAEVGARGLDSFNRQRESLSERSSLVFLVGSSRMRRGLIPRTLMRSLETYGVENAQAWNFAEAASKNIGAYRIYMEDIRPRIEIDKVRPIVLIELRAAGSNDGATTSDERDYVQQLNLAPLSPTASAAPAHDVDVSPTMSLTGLSDPASLARRMLATLRLLDTSDILERTYQRWSSAAAANSSGADSADLVPPDFGLGEELGWEPFREYRDRFKFAKTRYERILLRDYHLGGVQTEFLVRLIRRVHDDGGLAVLVIMPITDMHRTFGKHSAFDQFREHSRALAETEGVALIDLDTNHGLPETAFRDTHHLHETGARVVSQRLADALAGVILERR